MLQITAVKTPVFRESEKLAAFLCRELKGKLQAGDIVAVTSKLFSVDEKCIVPKASIGKRALIEREADRFLGEGPYGVCLTVKHGIFIPSAGIDESNSEHSDYLLFPEKPFESAERVRAVLEQELGINPLGLIMTDSHTTPLRWGVTGIALAFAGFHPVQNLVGRNDLFGRPLQFTRVNRVDALAAAAVLQMGESDESTPVAIIRGATVEFSKTIEPRDVQIPPDEDLYRDFFRINR
jgi:dihydrofolate synthase / folylpolyglutamate synthase